MRILSGLIPKFFIPFFMYLGTLNLYASDGIDLIETFGSNDYLLQQSADTTTTFNISKTQYLGKTPLNALRTIRTDIAGVYFTFLNNENKSVLIQTILNPPLSSSSTIGKVKDHEFTPSAFGKEQKIYNLIQAINTIKQTNKEYLNDYPGNVSYIQKKSTTASPNSWMSCALYLCRTPTLINNYLGELDNMLASNPSEYKYLGFFNDFLSRLRAIGIKNLTKPETLSENNPISILYAVTQIGSRGLNSALIKKIAESEGEITEGNVYSILKSPECLFDSIVGSGESTVANAAGTLMEQWNFITSHDNPTIASVTDTLSEDVTVSVSSTLQNVIKLINENYSTLKDADLVNLYNKLIPVTRPIQDAISTESIQQAYNKDDLSLQEYIYYLLTGVPQSDSAVELIEQTKKRIISCCESITELLDTPCCRDCCMSFDNLNQALYKTERIFNWLQRRFDSLPNIDLTNISFNFNTEINSINAAAVQEVDDASNPCKSADLIASLDSIQSKISQANTSLESLFSDYTCDPPYVSLIPAKPKKNDFCEIIKKITCDISDDENPITTIPSLLNQIQNSIQQLTQSIADISDFPKTKTSITALKGFIQKIQNDFQTNITALEKFPKQEDQYTAVDICKTEYPTEDGSSSQTPCHNITPHQIITASSNLDESFASLLETIQRVEHNDIHQKILQSLEMIRACNQFLFSSPHFEKICCSEEFSTLLSKISNSCSQYPDLSTCNFIYTDTLLPPFNTFLDSLKDTEGYLKNLLLKYEIIKENTLFSFSPSFSASIDGTKALWSQINHTMNTLIDAIRIPDIHIPIDSIGSQLQNINQNFQQIQWETSIYPSFSVHLDNTLSANLTSKINALQEIFKDPGCCKIAAQNAQKLLKVLTLLNAEDISLESLTHATSCDLYQRINTIMQNFSDTPRFLTELTDELTLYYKNFYQKDCDFSNLTPEGSCQTLLQTYQKINESLHTRTERILSFSQTFNTSSYDPDLLGTLELIRVFYQKMVTFFNEIFIPAMTISSSVIPTIDNLNNIPQCQIYCQLCNAALWSDEQSVLNIGENLSTTLSKIPENMKQIVPPLSLIESKIQERRCDSYADLLYSNHQHLQFISEAIQSINLDTIDAQKICLINTFIKQNSSNNQMIASPEEALSDELAFLTRLLEQISGNSFVETPNDSSDIIGHERIPALTFMMNDCLQEIINHVDAVIPNHINHYNSDLQEALSILLERLTGIPSLFSQLNPNNSACEACDSFVFDHLRLNIDPILDALESLKKQINDPVCHHKLSVSLKSLCDKISAFTVNHIIEDSHEDFTNLLAVLQSNTMCKADEMAEALEPLIQIFDNSFELNAEVIRIETSHPDFNWIDSMGRSVRQIFQELNIISDQIKKIALSIQHGDEIPAWIPSFHALHTVLKNIYYNPIFLPVCTHPIHQTLIQIIQEADLTALWDAIDANITEVKKNAHAHSYLQTIADLDGSVIKLQNHIQTLKEKNGYQWFSFNYLPLLQVIEDALNSQMQNGILPFLQQTASIIDKFNQSLNSLFSINSPTPSIIQNEYGHPTASLQLNEITQNFTTISSDFKTITTQKEWSEKHTANQDLYHFFMEASNLMDRRLNHYNILTALPIDCEYCGSLDFSHMIQQQQNNLKALHQSCLDLAIFVNTCFACEEIAPALLILSNQLANLNSITQQIKENKNPLQPPNVIEVMNCIESPVFSVEESIECTTAKIFINELNSEIKALNETLNRVYCNSSFNFDSPNSLLPSSNSCSSIILLTGEINTFVISIAKAVETITYDAMAPPADDWKPLINQSGTSLSMIVQQFLTPIMQALKQANLESCIGCNQVQLKKYFNDLTQAHTKTINHIIALENAWNSYEFDKVIYSHLQNIYYFKVLTHELVEWFRKNDLTEEFCQIINCWNRLIQEIGPHLSCLNLKGLNHFQTLSHYINYSILDFSSNNNSLENLNNQLIQLPDIANQNFDIIDIINEKLSLKNYFNPSLDYLFQQATETWNHFITDFYSPFFKVGPHTFKIPEDFAVFLSQLSQKWHDLSILMKQKNSCCMEKAKYLRPLVLTLMTIENEFNALSKITDIQNLNRIDLNNSLEALKELNQLMNASSQQLKTCREIAVLEELKQKLDTFRGILTTIRKLLTQDASDFALVSLDLIPTSIPSCESVEVSDQLIYYSLKNIKAYIQEMYDQSVQNQSTIWGQKNTTALLKIANTIQSISENLAALFKSWICDYCPLYFRNSCYQTNTANLATIAQIHSDLHDNVIRRCCNERAQDSVILTEYFYNFAHHFSITLANSKLLNQPKETLTQQLAQTCHLLTPHLPSILEWITQNSHQPLDSENCKQILHQLENLWSPQTHQTLPINHSLLGCEQINLCWFYIQSSMNEILNSISTLHQKIIGNVITPSLIEREALRKIATFFYQTFESFKNYTPECTACSKNDLSEAALACLHISKEIASLCSEESTCCKQRLTDIKSATQSIYNIQQALEIIATASKTTRLSDLVLKNVFENSPLADPSENAVTKLESLVKLVTEFAHKYDPDFSPVIIQSVSSNTCETIEYYTCFYKNSLDYIKNLLNQMAAYYITQDNISINSETADFISNLSSYADFLSEAPILDVCLDCQNHCIENCHFNTTDSMDLTEDITTIVDSLSNKCCLFESRLIHQIGLSIETISNIFNQLDAETLINCINNNSSLPKWRNLNKSIYGTITIAMKSDASFEAHLTSASNKEDLKSSDTPFLNRFTDHFKIIADNLKDCFNNSLLVPSHFLPNLKYNCSQKTADFQYIAEFFSTLSYSFEQISNAIIQNNLVYTRNIEIISTFENLKKLICLLYNKILKIDRSSCPTCDMLMQLKAPHEILNPSFSLLLPSLDKLLISISNPNCCHSKTQNLFILIGQLETIDYRFEKLGSVWGDKNKYDSLIGSASLNENLQNILTALTNIQDDYVLLADKNFEQTVNSLINGQQLKKIQDAISNIYTAYTNDQITETIDGKIIHANVPPCDRLNFTIYYLTDLFKKLMNHFDNIQIFWELRTPEYVPVFASQLSNLFDRLNNLRHIIQESIFNGFGHFSDCKDCIQSTEKEIKNFNLSLSQDSIASITSIYSSFRCAKDSLKRWNLLKALKQMTESVYGCVNFPIETVNVSTEIAASSEGFDFSFNSVEDKINITNTTYLNTFVINWSSNLQKLNEIINDKRDLFEEDDVTHSLKINDISQNICDTTHQIEEDFNNLDPAHVTNNQPIDLLPVIHSCKTNIYEQKEIANAISEILLGYIKGARWYLSQPYSFNINIYNAVLKLKELLTNCYSMPFLESDCPYCRNYLADTQRDILSSIHQCMPEIENFLGNIKKPKCSLLFINAFNAFNLALNDCVQQFSKLFPLPNKGEKYDFYKERIVSTIQSAADITSELEEFKINLSCLLLTLQTAHTTDILCLSSIPSITTQLNELTQQINDSLHGKISKLSSSLFPGTATITSDVNTNSEIIETNSLSNQEKINYIYLQVLSSLNYLNACFSQLEQDLKINNSEEYFAYSSSTIQIFERLKQCFSEIKSTICEFSLSEIHICLFTEKFQKNSFFNDINNNLDKINKTNDSIISILEDRLWNTLAPGIKNFINKNYEVNQKILFLIHNMENFSILDFKVCNKLLPSLENINNALQDQIGFWDEITVSDPITGIQKYNEILNDFNTQSLTSYIQAIADELNATIYPENSSPKLSTASLYTEQLNENMQLIVTHLNDQNNNLKKLVAVQIDESGNASMLLYLKNIQESISLLSPKIFNFFNAIHATFQEISSNYPDYITIQAANIQESLNDLANTFGELSLLFATGNCCKGLSSAYDFLMAETFNLSNRIQNNTDHFKIIDLFNNNTEGSLNSINSLLTELFDNFYSDASTDISHCKASQIKFYLIPNPKENKENITTVISKIYPNNSNLNTMGSSSKTQNTFYCTNLRDNRENFLKAILSLENAIYSLITPIQLNGLQPDENINFMDMIINKIIAMRDIMVKIYTNKKNHTCNTCAVDSDKEFFNHLSQHIDQIHINMSALKDTAVTFCCNKSSEKMLIRVYSFAHNVSNQIQQLHQNAVNFIQINSKIKTFLPVCVSLYKALQPYFDISLHILDKDKIIDEITSILESIDSSDTDHLIIKPFNKNIIPIYFSKIIERLETLPPAFISLTNAVQSISYASYPELCANLKTFGNNVEDLAQLFNTSSHANSLLHDENSALKTHKEIYTVLHFLSQSINTLKDTILNSSKEKMIQKTVSHINISFQRILNAIHLLGQYIHNEINFGSQTKTVIKNLQLFVQNFPNLSTVAQAWIRIRNETPVQSFDELNTALTTEQNTLELATNYILSIASTYNQNNPIALTIHEADTADIILLNVALTNIQQTIHCITEELDEITQTIQNCKSRNFHADIIEILSTTMLEKLKQWENAYIILTHALQNSSNTTYNVYEYADILQNIARTIHRIPFKIINSVDTLFNLKASKKTEFLAQIAIRINALTEGSNLIHSSNTHLDEAKAFFNQFVPLSKQLVESYIQLQHTPSYSSQEEDNYIEYLSLLDQLIQITQSTFNISINVHPKLVTLRFDHAFLKEIASQIQDSLTILFENYQKIQNEWLIQEPYAIQPALIRDCSIIVKTLKTMASTWNVAPFVDALHLFISKLHQPTCCQASSVILCKIETDFSQIVHILHQLTSAPIPVLDEEYLNLIAHLNAITEYISEAQDEHTICYNIENIKHLDEQNVLYLENLSQIEEKVNAMKSRFNAIAQIFKINMVEPPLEGTLSNYCLQKERSFSKIADHFRTLQQIFSTLTSAFAPQIGIVRPYRPELITFFKDTVSSALKQFIQTFSILQQSHKTLIPCQTCNKVQIQKYLTNSQNECAASISPVLRVIHLLETFQYSAINQLVHEIMISQSHIENTLNTFIQNHVAITSNSPNEINTINTTLLTLQSSWSEFIQTAKSTDTTVFCNPIQTLLQSIHQNYKTIHSNLLMNAQLQGDQNAITLYYPEIAYTASNMEIDCERIRHLSNRIQNHLSTLYEESLKKRPYNLTIADLFHNAYILNRYLYEHQNILTNIMDPIPHHIIQNFIPSAESLPLFRRFSFLFDHQQCCEPYVESIKTIGSNFSALIHSIEKLISITPFISIQTDEEAANVAQYLKATTSRPSSILQLLNHLRPSIQELIQHISLNFNPFCFAAPDKSNHLNLLNGIQQQITDIHAILNQINGAFSSTFHTPISLSELPDQISNANIYYDEQIAANWQEINTALKSYEQDIQTVITLSETKENWCILNDSRAPILKTLQALKQIFELRYYSEKALEAYNTRCCSLASDKLNELSYYASTLSTIENISLTNENINNAITRFQFISKNLIDISHYIQKIVEKSFHNRQTIFLLDQTKRSLINISRQLNTRLDAMPPFISQVETCDSLVEHLKRFANYLFGKTSFYIALSQWGSEVKAACNGSSARCYEPLFIDTIYEITTTLNQLSHDFIRLNTQKTSFCPTCDLSIRNTFEEMSHRFILTTKVFEEINNDLNQPTCCYNHEQDLIFLFSELNDLEQLLSYCRQNSNVLINALNDPNISNITQNILTAVQNFSLLEENNYINPNHQCCAEFFNPHFHQFLYDQLAPFLNEIKNVLKTLTGMNPNPPTYPNTDLDNCKNVFKLSAFILDTFQNLTEDMQKLHTYFESLSISFYDLNFINALKKLLKLSWQITPHIIPQEYFCSGCNRSFSDELKNLHTTHKLEIVTTPELQIATMNAIDQLLGNFESILNIMEKRWCKEQASAWNHLVDTAEFVENLIQNLLNYPFDDWKKETAYSIQQPLVHLIHAYHQIETTLSTPLNWHQAPLLVTALNDITYYLNDAGTRITQLFNEFAIPYEPFKATPTNNDFDSIVSNMERLCQSLDQTTLTLSQNCHKVAPDHIAIIPTWRALNQAFSRLISKIEISCDCHSCMQISVSKLYNTLKGIDLQQQKWIQNLEGINCCDPLQEECIEMDQIVRRLAQTFFITKKDAIHNLTCNEATKIEKGMDNIIQCFGSLEACLKQNTQLKQQNNVYICAATHTSIAPVIELLNALQNAFISTVNVYSPQVSVEIQNTSINPSVATSNEQIFDTLVNDLQYLRTQIDETFEYINLAPVRDIHTSTLEKFAQLIEAFNTFYTITTPSILDMVNPCIHYDNCETRQIITKIPSILNNLKRNLDQKFTALNKMCCSRLSYQVYQFVDHLDIIRQAFAKIQDQGSNVIKEFLANPKTQTIAKEINQEIDPNAPNSIANQWEIVIQTGVSKAANNCAARSLEAFLDRWNNLLTLLTSAPLNYLQQTTIKSQIEHPPLYRCKEISTALNLGLNTLNKLNTILGEIHDKIENTPFSYYDIFSAYKTFYFFDKLLEEGNKMLKKLSESNEFIFCNHCDDSIQPLPLFAMQPAFETTQTHINHLMTIFHKACDDDIAKIVQERNLLLNSFTEFLLENFTKDERKKTPEKEELESSAKNESEKIQKKERNIITFWTGFDQIDLNSIANNCQDIANTLDTYKGIQSHHTICLLPLVYDDEQKINENLFRIFNSLMAKMEKKYIKPNFSSISHISYAESRSNTLAKLENFGTEINKLFFEIENRGLITEKPQSVATVNKISAIALKLENIIDKEKEIYTLWNIDTPCPRWTRCTTCSTCNPCLPHCLCTTNDLDVRLVLWEKSNRIKTISDYLINFSAKLIDDCCCEAFKVLFQIPSQLISIQKIIEIWLENKNGDEKIFSEDIQEITKFFQQLDLDTQNLVQQRNEAQKKQERCNMGDLIPSFEQMLETSKKYAEHLEKKLGIDSNHLESETWTTEGNKCDSLKLMLPQIQKTTIKIGEHFQTFAEKISTHEVMNTQAISPLIKLTAQLNLFKENLSKLKINESSRSLCAKCDKEKINTEISAIAVRIGIISQHVLKIKNILFRQNCCINFSQQLQRTPYILISVQETISKLGDDLNTSVQEGLPALSSNLPQLNTIAVSMIVPLQRVKDQLYFLVDKRKSLSATDTEPCFIEELVSPMKGLNDHLVELLQNLHGNTSLPIPDSNLSVAFDCSNLAENINDISKAWKTMNNTIQETFLELQNFDQPIFDPNFLSTMRNLYQLTQDITSALNLYYKEIESKTICLKCNEAANDNRTPQNEEEPNKTPTKQLSLAFSQLPQNSEDLNQILAQFITALQNQCCYNIINSIDPVLQKYAKFVVTIKTLSSVESFGQYLGQNLNALNELIVSYNEQLDALNSSMNRLIQKIKNDDKAAVNSSEITPEQEASYISEIQCIGKCMQSILDKTIHFAKPIYNNQDLLQLLNDLKPIKLNKSSHCYVVEILNIMNGYTLDLSNSILKIKDAALTSNSQDTNIKLQINLLSARIQRLKLLLVSQFQSILPNKHMKKLMETNNENIDKLEKIWNPTKEIMLHLIDSCQLFANIWMNSLCYQDLLSEIKIWSQSLNQSTHYLNNIVECPIDAIVLPPSDNNLNNINELFLQFSKLSSAIQRVDEILMDSFPIREDKVLSQIKTSLTPIIKNLSTHTQSIHTLLINALPAPNEDATPMSDDLSTYTQLINSPSLQPENKDTTSSNNCQNISYIVRNFGESISNFNTSLIRFTYISPDLYQRFNISLPSMEMILTFSQAQFTLEQEMDRILHFLPTLPLCANSKQSGLLISSHFAIQEMLKLAQSFSIIQETLLSIQTKILNNEEANFSKGYFQSAFDEGESKPIIDLIFQPQYDERGLPRISETGEIFANPDSLYAQAYQTNANSSHLFCHIFGNEINASPCSEHPA